MGVSVVKNRLAGDGNQMLHHLQVCGWAARTLRSVRKWRLKPLPQKATERKTAQRRLCSIRRAAQ